ncbi:MAG: hypothetical protein D6831_02805 [Aquificota bacterium]|nr:MAG: hypothetical protein D6831_02805 [Aquificota bacterium]
MGNFFRDLKKLYRSLETLEKQQGENVYIKRGKGILSILSHIPFKELKSVSKKESFIERFRNSLFEEGFRIHIRNKRIKVVDFLSKKKENFYTEIIYSGENIIVKWPNGFKEFDFEMGKEEKILKEFSDFLEKFLSRNLFYSPPEKISVNDLRKFLS